MNVGRGKAAEPRDDLNRTTNDCEEENPGSKSTTTASTNVNASILPSAQSGIKALPSNIDESNVKGYYYVLKAMSLAANLNNNSSKEDVLKVWTDNKSTIQKCKSIKFAEESITELPYNALNEMSSLAELNISHNQLTSISDRIGDLKNLTKLGLYNNKLTSISDRIGDLKNLTKLYLSDNQLTSIPDRIWNLSNLTELSLSQNQLTSISDRIGDLSNLTKLYLSQNQLTSISDRIGDLKNLIVLNISRNGLINIPESIGSLLKLKGLDLPHNQLTSIPENIGDLKNLTELDLSDNRLKSIPESIGDLKNLAVLDLSQNQLTSISDRIGDLKNLIVLNISRNGLINIPESIGSLLKLKGLDLPHNQLTSIPENIGDLKNLTELDLSDNRLKSIPESIGNLSNLTKLDLSDNQLKSIPESIGNLSNLTKLYLSDNQLTSISDRIGDLKNLTELDLSDNRLKSIPESIGDLSNLTKLGLYNNKLTSIPDRIGDLKNLTGLDLSDNRLKSIPESIGNLSNLTKLYLSDNQLTSIPDRIWNLSNLTELSLSQNQLTSISDRIGDLSNLTKLGLSDNQLTFVPSTIKNLRNTLDLVDIRYNEDIARHGDSETSFGLEQLIEMFGSNLYFTEPRITPIPVVEAYEKLMRMPIYWNFNRLKQLRATPIPQIDMTMDEMMTIWMSLPKEGIDESNTNAMTGFIHDIYNPDEQYNRDWPMAREYLQLSKNLLGSVLNILSMKSETDKELAESNINGICEGLKHCNDRKLSELRLAYYILMDQLDNKDEIVDSLINNIISSEKEKVFNFTFIRNTSQNVHLLNYWKYQLRDEVGFDFDVSTIYGAQGLDPFNGHPGNALAAFYSKFTPEHAIKELTIRINQKENRTHMSELMGIIANDNELTTEEKKSMLVGDIETSMFTEITREGVKYYLLKRGLIIQNQE